MAARVVEGLTREEICSRYQDKVMLLARRVQQRLPPSADLELGDLVAHGAIGLLEAFERFEPARGIRFSTFAEYRIRGAMVDAVRERDPLGRRRRQLARKLDAAARDLEQELGRRALPEEVAERAELPMRRYWQAVSSTAPVHHVSLDQPEEPGGRPLWETLGDPDRIPPETRMTRRQTYERLRDAIRELPERERHCVLLYYDKGLTLAEVGEIHGVGTSRVSQILSTARRRLRRALEAG